MNYRAQAEVFPLWVIGAALAMVGVVVLIQLFEGLGVL